MGPVHPDYADALRVELAMYEQAGRDDRAAQVRDELVRIGAEKPAPPVDDAAKAAKAAKAAAKAAKRGKAPATQDAPAETAPPGAPAPAPADSQE